METNRTDNRAQESGIALVSALLVTGACMLFIAGVYFLMGSGWKVALINKTFSSVQEAATGGAEHAAEIVRLLNNEAAVSMISNLGIVDTNVAKSAIYDCDKTQTARVEAKTANGRYTMRVTVKCSGNAAIPGTTTYKFPPPPTKLGGLPSFYFFYAIVSEAKDVQNNNVAKVESVYRLAR